MESLPEFEDGVTYFVSGGTLNALAAAIEARTPIAGEGIESTETPDGVILSVAGGALEARMIGRTTDSLAIATPGTVPNLYVFEGSFFHFTIHVDAAHGELAYQWERGFSPYSTFQISFASETHAGLHTCEVTCGDEKVTLTMNVIVTPDP